MDSPGKKPGAWLVGLMGLGSLIWFLVRVIPKPSRAAYPCQRAAAPLAGGFVIWVAGLVSARALYRRAAARNSVALAALALAVLAAWLPLGVTTGAPAQYFPNPEDKFIPSEGPNHPMGQGRGIHPGRVVWVHDPDATSWDGKTGNWWDDANTNQREVDGMISRALQNLTGRKSDQQAWDALFKHFNREHKLGDTGYRRGEKIAIKINANQDREAVWTTGRGVPSPHVISALVAQLINSAGVLGEDISIYEVTRRRFISDPIYKRIRANSNPSFQGVRFVVEPDMARDGREAAKWDRANPIRFSDPGMPAAYLPQNLTESKYLINLALLRAHTLNGVTLTAKNHYGATYFPEKGGWSPVALHGCGAASRPMGSYNCLVDLVGHRHLGGKTLLYMIDGLYSAEHNEGYVMRFLSFGDDWPSSIFLSQDPVAIDSVALDFLRNEPRATRVLGKPDNYLHEAALAGNPPSGTVYDPERDGTRLTSLGVHEHWNNATAKQYSRNLGRSEGIELVAAR